MIDLSMVNDNDIWKYLNMSKGAQHFLQYRWFSTRLHYLHCTGYCSLVLKKHRFHIGRLTFLFRWGLKKLSFMAEFNFVRGFDVYKERTLSLVTLGYQEVVAYLESALREAGGLLESDDTMRAALYVSGMKDIRRIQVIYCYGLV